MDKISVVILSGGRSSRMGRDKANLCLYGKTFVELLSERLAPADEILFSVRNPEDFPEVPLDHVADEFPGCGPLAGIHAALGVCRNPWLFAIACDTPFVTWELVQKLHSFASEDTEAVIPVGENGKIHAVCGLYHKSMRKQIGQQLVRSCFRVRSLLEQSKVCFVPAQLLETDGKTFQNVNTLEDYQQIKGGEDL